MTTKQELRELAIYRQRKFEEARGEIAQLKAELLECSAATVEEIESLKIDLEMMKSEKEHYRMLVYRFFKKYPPGRDLYGEIAELEAELKQCKNSLETAWEMSMGEDL